MPIVQEKMARAIRAFEAGEIVVVTDDDDRENEGDLIIAAAHCTAEKMAFIIRHTSGIVCAPMTAADARRLNLPAMVAENDAPHSTAFTVSVDYRHGTTTGISAEVLYVNLDMLEALNGQGLVSFTGRGPQTLDEFREFACASTTLTDPSGNPVRGFPLPVSAFSMYPYIYGNADFNTKVISEKEFE
jgi:hypothetical protein